MEEDWPRFLEEPPEPLKKKKKPWQLLWDPEAFEKENPEMSIDKFKLSKKGLEKAAVTCS